MALDDFLPHLGRQVDEDQRAIDRALEQVVARAREAHRGIVVPSATFLPYVAKRLPKDGQVVSALESLRAEHLYLACASAHGDERAIAAIERLHFHQVNVAHAQLRVSPAQAEDLTQLLRERLFVSGSGSLPGIASYSGRGDLGRWLRAVALRAAIDQLRASGHEVASDDLLADMAMPGDDPAVAGLKDRYAAEFKAALKEALASLGSQVRTELKLYYLDGLNLDVIASLSRVSPSTISRRLARGRNDVLEGTRRVLRERLDIGETELESILGLISSRMELARSALEQSI